MDPKTLAEITGGEWHNLIEDFQISSAALDSRILEPGQCFVALKTPRGDGHEHVAAAFNKGASAALVSHLCSQGPCLVVKDPYQALCQWAAYAREHFQGIVIGVVGSVGKTTTKELLAHLLSADSPVYASPQSFNNHLGVPLTLVGAPQEARYLVVEMGTNSPGDLDQLGALAKPDHLFVTPIGEAHLEGLRDLDGVRRAKSEILNHLNPSGWLAWPFDPDLQKVWCWSGRQFTWGAEGADIPAFECTLNFPKTTVDVGDLSIELDFPAIWAGPLLAGIGELLRKLGVEPKWDSLSHFQSLPSRLQVLDVNDLTIINDAWNANPVSMTHSLDILSASQGRHVFVLGDMLEMGEETLLWHRKIGRYCQGKVDLLLCVGEQAHAAAEEFSGESHLFSNLESCEKGLTSLVKEGDVVLFKGSRALSLDKLANRFVPRRESV